MCFAQCPLRGPVRTRTPRLSTHLGWTSHIILCRDPSCYEAQPRILHVCSKAPDVQEESGAKACPAVLSAFKWVHAGSLHPWLLDRPHQAGCSPPMLWGRELPMLPGWPASTNRPSWGPLTSWAALPCLLFPESPGKGTKRQPAGAPKHRVSPQGTTLPPEESYSQFQTESSESAFS